MNPLRVAVFGQLCSLQAVAKKVNDPIDDTFGVSKLQSLLTRRL